MSTGCAVLEVYAGRPFSGLPIVWTWVTLPVKASPVAAATVISAIQAAKTPDVTHAERVTRLCVDRPPSTAFKRE
jgi:hypothetical protein